MERGGVCIKDESIFEIGFDRHGVAGESGEIGEEGAEAVDGEAVIGSLCRRFAIGGR